MLLLAAMIHAAVAAPPGVSFRNGGSAVFADAVVPAAWDPKTCWQADVPSWSNSSPVVLGDLVCTLSEPTTLSCHDRATGRERWRATNDYVDTLQGDERRTWVARLAGAPARAEEARELQRAYSEVRRQVRSDPTNPALAARLDELGARLSEAREAVRADEDLLTPPDREVIGYTTHSPVTDGERLYVQLGHGVVSAFLPDGTRVWSVWLGPAPAAMRGYHTGSAASPLLVDGLLVVGHRQLTALDPATGAVRWRSVPYTDFGTPAAGHVGGVGFVATPDGTLVATADGRVLAEDLDDPWYVGPLVVDDVVYWVGGNAQHQASASVPAHASAHRVRADGAGGLTTEVLWRTDVPATEPFFVSPVADADALYTVDASAQVWRVARADGGVTAVAKAPVGPAYTSPQLLRGLLVVGGEDGAVAVLDAGGTTLRARHVLPMSRATPVAAGGRIYLRALEGLLCVGGGG